MAGFTITSTLEILHDSLCRAHILATAGGAADDEGTLIDLSTIKKKGAVPDANGQFAGGLQPLGIKYKRIKGTMTGNITLLLESKGVAADQTIQQFKANADDVTIIDVDFTDSPNGGFKPYLSEGVLADTTFDAATGDITVSADNTIYKVGSSSAKMAIAAPFTTGLIASDDFSSFNAAGYDGVGFWIRSSVALQPSDLSALIDNTSACASPLETMPIKLALAADTWYWVELPFTAQTTRTAVISFGIQANRDFGAANIYIDGIRFKKMNPSINVASAIGDLVGTTTGSASGDQYELEVEFELVWSGDNYKGAVV